MKRDYLLSNGCKDLIDTLYIQVPEKATLADIAPLLHQSPPKLIADLFLMGVFASTQQNLSFEIVSKLAHKYGYVAKREPTGPGGKPDAYR